MRLFLTWKATAVAGALVLGLALGTAASGVAAATLATVAPTVPAPHIFPKNASGQTYGSGMDATSPYNMPDLVQAIGVGGIEGYVRLADLNGPMPQTPAQAIALMKDTKSGTVRQIPLYAQDGKTVIGVFDVGGTSAVYTSQSQLPNPVPQQ